MFLILARQGFPHILDPLQSFKYVKDIFIQVMIIYNSIYVRFNIMVSPSLRVHPMRHFVVTLLIVARALLAWHSLFIWFLLDPVVGDVCWIVISMRTFKYVKETLISLLYPWCLSFHDWALRVVSSGCSSGNVSGLNLIKTLLLPPVHHTIKLLSNRILLPPNKY